jgi:hypothetical protein
MPPDYRTHKAGNHAFRRFRNTYLRNYAESRGPLQILDGPVWKGHERPLRQNQSGRCIPQEVGGTMWFRVRVTFSCTQSTEMFRRRNGKMHPLQIGCDSLLGDVARRTSACHRCQRASYSATPLLKRMKCPWLLPVVGAKPQVHRSSLKRP